MFQPTNKITTLANQIKIKHNTLSTWIYFSHNTHNSIIAQSQIM